MEMIWMEDGIDERERERERREEEEGEKGNGRLRGDRGTF